MNRAGAVSFQFKRKADQQAYRKHLKASGLSESEFNRTALRLLFHHMETIKPIPSSALSGSRLVAPSAVG